MQVIAELCTTVLTTVTHRTW